MSFEKLEAVIKARTGDGERLLIPPWDNIDDLMLEVVKAAAVVDRNTPDSYMVFRDETAMRAALNALRAAQEQLP